MKKPAFAVLLAGLVGGGCVLAQNEPGWQTAASGIPHANRPINIGGKAVFTPMVFGARGDGVADDTSAVQQAIDHAAYSTLYLGRHRYCVNALSISTPVRILGGVQSAQSGSAEPAFVACSANRNLITIRKTASGTVLKEFAILMGQNGIVNTRGAAVVDRAPLTRVAGVLIDRPCIGIDEEGNSNTYTVRINNVQGGACVGIRLGNGMTDDGSIDARIINSTIVGEYPPVSGSIGMEFLAAGGTYLANNDILYTQTGTAIVPGAGQSGHWLSFANTVLGDSTLGDALRIDTRAVSAVIGGLKFAGTWTGSAGRNQHTGT